MIAKIWAFIKKYHLIRWGGIMMGLGILSPFIFYYSVRWGMWEHIPSNNELKDIQNHVASEVYSWDGKLLGKFFIENRTNVKREDLPDDIINALIATEDARFYKHKGTDRRSVMRVLVKTILLGNKSSGGGSTLSQQLAKNLYPRQNHGMFSMPVAKIKEMVVARRLEKLYNKEEILTLYLNTVTWGGDVFGIEVAAERFFSKKVKDLKTEEAAMLIGMLKGPTRYSPRLYPERCLKRRNVVLSQMKKYKYLEPPIYDSLQQIPIQLNYHRITHTSGLATYFRDHLRRELKAWTKDYKWRFGKEYNIYTDGLKIYTSIDSTMQWHAEEAMKKQMARLQKQFDDHWGNDAPWGNDLNGLAKAKLESSRYLRMRDAGASTSEIDKAFKENAQMEVFDWTADELERDTVMTPLDSIKYHARLLNAGFMVMEPESGHVKAWVGGINFKYFKFDHVKGRRQVGSTFKPFVFATALENGVKSPCDYIPNERRAYADYQNWAPSNSDGMHDGFFSMKGAITNSVNTATVSVMMEVGPQAVINKVQQLGIKSPLPELPSIALGAGELPLMEMVPAYCAIANGGLATKAKYLLKIVDRKGKIVFDGNKEQKERVRVLKDSTTRMLTKMLSSVVDSGTARRLRFHFKLDGDLAGKTGTTQSQTDGWFLGFCPKLVGGAWVGGEDTRVRFRSIRLGQGANTALPIWGEFLKRLSNDPEYKDYVEGEFRPPTTEDSLAMSCSMFTLELPEEKPVNPDKTPDWVSNLIDKINDNKPKPGRDKPKNDKPTIKPDRGDNKPPKNNNSGGNKPKDNPKPTVPQNVKHGAYVDVRYLNSGTVKLKVRYKGRIKRDHKAGRSVIIRIY